jgi:hypothetical protein
MKEDKYTNQEIGALADAFGKSIPTIKRWIKNDDDRLTSDRAKATIKNIKNV